MIARSQNIDSLVGRAPNRSTVMHGGQRLITQILLGIALLASSAPVHADARVQELAKSLTSGSAKTRIAAVTALARLEDKTALKPLVDALKDPNAQVREIAAVALGKLGHKAALPALRTAADEDAEPAVQKRAKDAAKSIARANALPDPWPAPTPSVAARSSKAGGSAGFGRQAHAVEGQPNLYVTINTAADDSPGKADKPTRKMHGEILKGTLKDSFRRAPLVTMAEADAQRWGLDPKHLDLSVTKLEVVQTGAMIECEAQLRLAISDNKGKMLSFLSGGAKVQVPRRTYNQKYLPSLRKEALENAMRGMVDKLLMQLRDKSQS